MAVPLLVLRADATAQSGGGHLMRCLALAQAWRRRGGEAVFVSRLGDAAWRERLEKAGVKLVALSSRAATTPELETVETLAALERFGGAPVVLDGYSFSDDLRLQIRNAGHWLLCLDDEGHDFPCDALLNQNLGAEALFEDRVGAPQRLLGPKWVLLREEFLAWKNWKRETAPEARKILVTLGGSDPENVTSEVVLALRDLKEARQIRVLLGASNKHETSIRAAIGNDERFEVVRDARDMPEQFVWADVAISAGGSTCWEMAFMALPNLILVLADNQLLIAQALEERSVSVNLGPVATFEENLIVHAVNALMKNAPQRTEMSCKGRILIDGLGAERVAKFIAERNQ